MSRRRRWSLWIALSLAGIAALAAVIVLVLRPREEAMPGPGSQRYEEMVSAFFSGVAALDSDANTIAREALTKATTLVPQEPASWANLALAEIRLGHFDTAEPYLSRAQTLAPSAGAIERMFAILEARRGRFPESVAHLRRAIAIDPGDLRSRYALFEELGRQEGGDAEALELLGEIVKAEPDNTAALLDRARLAAKAGNREILDSTIQRLATLSTSWPTAAKERYKSLVEAAAGENLRLVPTRVLVLRNVLLTAPSFRESLATLALPVGAVGEPIETFLRLAPPPATPAPPDLGIRYAIETPFPVQADVVAVVPQVDKTPPIVLAINGREVRRADREVSIARFPGGPKEIPPTPAGVVVADWTSDSVVDLVLAGTGGVTFHRGNVDGTFVDVTADTKLGPEILQADTFGAWVADIEMDGDLDVVVALRKDPPVVLINHGDGTFHIAKPFSTRGALRAFAWADFDQDGDPDAAMIDESGTLGIFRNERSGKFEERPIPEDLTHATALAVADSDGDGKLDLLLLRRDAIVRLSDRGTDQAWESAVLMRGIDTTAARVGDSRLLVADLDNNGALDLIASASSNSRIWLGKEPGKPPVFVPSPGLRVFSIVDLNDDGLMDVAGISKDRRVSIGRGKGSKSYGWVNLLPRAARAVGDGRINSFGLGGEIQLRAGLLFQSQLIAGPTVHFGLGSHRSADVARVVWPNGTMQAEFNPRAAASVVAQQRLKGSCPFLYAFDGEKQNFVTDFLWRSPLGLRINAQDTAGVSQTEDWVKIRRDQLAPRDGFYDLRITAELWETHYWDHVSLMTIDHPEGTEVFVDERFARVPPPLAIHATSHLRPVSRAVDDLGNDVTEIVRERDGRYLDTFGRGTYQGVTRDHFVEIDLEAEHADSPLMIVACGWIHPTDSSLNVALGQNRQNPPQGLVLEVPDGDGNWVVVRDDLGFPAGKHKTILISLDGIFRPGAPRRVRLRSNLEIYWDFLALAHAERADALRTRRLAPSLAELRYRGFSEMTQADDSSPEVPRYDRIDGTRQHWNDLIGLYTRFGDVRDLLQAVDDRYVIANAGDELALRFPAPPEPPGGWVRDFVLIGDGWNKDGDYNTAFSKTVLPLPSHANPRYDSLPRDLEDDPVYREHPQDWEAYHTRYITPRTFWEGIRPPAAARP